MNGKKWNKKNEIQNFIRIDLFYQFQKVAIFDDIIVTRESCPNLIYFRPFSWYSNIPLSTIIRDNYFQEKVQHPSMSNYARKRSVV